MPDFLVHQIIATRTLDNLSTDINKRIKAHQSAFIFGAQGPDFFYYRGLLNPLKSFKAIHQLSDCEHTQTKNTAYRTSIVPTLINYLMLELNSPLTSFFNLTRLFLTLSHQAWFAHHLHPKTF